MSLEMWSPRHGRKPIGAESLLQRWQNKIRAVRPYLRGWAKNHVGENRRMKSFLLQQLDGLDRKAELLLLSPQYWEYKNCLHT